MAILIPTGPGPEGSLAAPPYPAILPVRRFRSPCMEHTANSLVKACRLHVRWAPPVDCMLMTSSAKTIPHAQETQHPTNVPCPRRLHVLTPPLPRRRERRRCHPGGSAAPLGPRTGRTTESVTQLAYHSCVCTRLKFESTHVCSHLLSTFFRLGKFQMTRRATNLSVKKLE